MSEEERELSSAEFQTDPVVQHCIVLQGKLACLTANFRAVSFSDHEALPIDQVSVQQEQLMARVNSLKKALSDVIDATESGEPWDNWKRQRMCNSIAVVYMPTLHTAVCVYIQLLATTSTCLNPVKCWSSVCPHRAIINLLQPASTQCDVSPVCVPIP